MSDQVVVLKGNEGAYYIIGAHMLDQAKVQSEEHVKLLDKLVEGKSPTPAGNIKGVALSSYGEINVSDDRFLMLEYVPPQYAVLSNHSMPS